MDSAWSLEQKAGRVAATQGRREVWMGPHSAQAGGLLLCTGGSALRRWWPRLESNQRHAV